MKLCMIWTFADGIKHLQITKGTPTIFERILKESGTHHKKKWVKRMEACLAANGLYFEKENVKCMALESDGDVSK